MTDDVKLNERIARLEEKLEGHISLNDTRAEKLAAIDAKLDRITFELARYRGFVGGILLIGTALTTFFKLFWSDIVHAIK